VVVCIWIAGLTAFTRVFYRHVIARSPFYLDNLPFDQRLAVFEEWQTDAGLKHSNPKSMPMSDCLFCKIAAGAIPSQKVYENDTFYAFHDIRPAAPVHVLVIPRRHIATLSDCAPEDAPLLGQMLILIAQLAAQLGLADHGHHTMDAGFRTVINTGPGGGQEIDHLHAHLLGGKRPWSRMG
jgi:histidine triad (HIT) family protein